LSDILPTYNQYRIEVPQEYEEVITHFYYADNKTNEVVTHQLIPSYQTVLVFVFGELMTISHQDQEEVALDKCIVLGPIKKSMTYSIHPRSSMLVVHFKDDAFYRFFGTALIDQATPMHPDELVLDNCFTMLWKQLSVLSTTEEKVDLVLTFCRPYIKPQESVAQQLSNFDGAALSPIKAIAEENGQSERSIQLRHKKYFGYSAKEINRYQRFLQALEIINIKTVENETVNWFDIIVECGYYDQSRLIHDFRYYLNLTPTKYLQLQEYICNPIP